MQRARALSAFAVTLVVCSGTVAGLTAGAGPAPAATRSIHAHRVAGGLNFPAAFTFAPDGRIFYGEKNTGEIHILDPKTHRDHRFFRVPNVSSSGEQGLLGLALHPAWPAKRFVFAYATRNVSGKTRNQIVRIKSSGGRGSGMRVVFTSSTLAATFHDGGHIAFGPDKMLYAVVGEAGNPANSQNRKVSGGKVLRMTPGGKPAPGNPFGNRVFAYGIRNSFGFDFDPRTGRLWETEAGPECNDELNRIIRGRNYGWGPHETCSTPPQPPRNTNQDGPKPVLPQRFYNPVITPTGVAFCKRCRLGRSAGKLFFGAYNTGQIRRVKLGTERKNVVSQRVVFRHGSGILSMEVSPKGRIFFSDGSGIYRLVFS